MVQVAGMSFGAAGVANASNLKENHLESKEKVDGQTKFLEIESLQLQ
jgi:hypothetical protein